MTKHGNRLLVLVAALIIGPALMLARGRTDEPGPRSARPRYNAAGELLRPEGYRSWVFVGADLGLDYSQRNDPSLYAPPKDADTADEARPFHNVYIDREGYDHFLRTGRFPDKTVLVLELFEAKRKDPRHVVTAGLYEGKRIALEVAIKDLERPDGSKTPWAYYDFTGKPGPSGQSVRESARAKPDASCFDCHKKHADVDNVWVQFYPNLRDLPHAVHQ